MKVWYLLQPERFKLIFRWLLTISLKVVVLLGLKQLEWFPEKSHFETDPLMIEVQLWGFTGVLEISINLKSTRPNLQQGERSSSGYKFRLSQTSNHKVALSTELEALNESATAKVSLIPLRFITQTRTDLALSLVKATRSSRIGISFILALIMICLKWGRRVDLFHRLAHESDELWACTITGLARVELIHFLGWHLKGEHYNFLSELVNR